MNIPPDGGDSPAAVPPERAGRRWLILFVGLIAMTAGCTFQCGIAYLIPALRQVLALSIGAIGFGASFAIVALFPLAAAFVVPVAAEGSGTGVTPPRPRAPACGRGFMITAIRPRLSRTDFRDHGGPRDGRAGPGYGMRS